MKQKLMKRFLITIALIASLTFSAGNAFAITNANSVVAPYWEANSAGVYTFLAVTHPSLSFMATQIGIKMTAYSTNGNNAAINGSSLSFTVSSGSTTQFFIAGTNDSAINSTSLGSAPLLITTSGSSGAKGNLRFQPVATNPKSGAGSFPGTNDITALAFWGAVVIRASVTGFAMEFIGDAHDSIAFTGAGFSGLN
jgi:hypothetical protein